LSVVIWIAAMWGLAWPFPRCVATLVAVIWMKSLGTPPPAKIAAWAKRHEPCIISISRW
jgi:hypothetical protein